MGGVYIHPGIYASWYTLVGTTLPVHASPYHRADWTVVHIQQRACSVAPSVVHPRVYPGVYLPFSPENKPQDPEKPP